MGAQKARLIMERTLKNFLWIIAIIFVLLFIRLAWLQLFNAELYRTQAVSNTIRWIVEPASRGEITAAGGEVIATNRPVYNLTLDYLGLQDQDTNQVINSLVEILNDPEITFEGIKEAIQSQGSRLFEPIIIKRDIPIELVTKIEERRRNLPGVNITVQPQRFYPFGTLAGHLLGYVHSIKEELEQPGFEDYGMGDLVGKTGIEKYYEQYLRGTNGYTQMEVTAKNRPVRQLSSIPSVQGNTVVLTMDLKLQQAMEKSFDEALAKVQAEHPKALAGGAVLLEVKTGKVLAMTSRPVLNPDDFNGRPLNQEQADYYFRNIPPALYNRVIQGSYVPGSAFKPITGMAALESGQMDPLDTVVCTGKYWNPPYIKCWGVHGTVNYYSAMANSCNVYFQEMGRRAGISQIGRVGGEFGLNKPTGIDLPFEGRGILPDLQWQEIEFSARAEKINKEINDKIIEIELEYQEKIDRAAGEQEIKRLQNELKNQKRIWEQERKIRLEHYTAWHDWDTYNTSIGQGYNQFTIIQLANYAATIANGGKHFKPYTVEKILDHNGNVVQEFQPQLINQVLIKPENIMETKKAMQAVTAPGGTAYSLFKHFPQDLKVAAKTGTAQPGREGYVKNKDFDGLFIAFAPVDDPQIAFAGVMEHGYSGGGSMGLVAKAVFEEHFGLEAPELGNEKLVVDTPAGMSTVEGE